MQWKQEQRLAYSLDYGRTWTKYSHNPVLATNHLRHIRDPKLFWYKDRWIMALANAPKFQVSSHNSSLDRSLQISSFSIYRGFF